MRTTIKALTEWPLLAEFTMGLLRHLIGRRVWLIPRLWTGFVKCCQEGLPHSLPVLLSLPGPQLVEVLEVHWPAVREPLTSYAASHLEEASAEALDALGLAEEEALDV